MRAGTDDTIIRAAPRAVRMIAVVCAAVCLPAGTALAATAWRLGGAGPAQARAQNPSPPASVSAACASPATAHMITVTWSSVTNATSYTVSQSTTSATSGFTPVATGLMTTSWTSGTLANGHTYWYEITVKIGAIWQSAASTATTGRAITPQSPYCQ